MNNEEKIKKLARRLKRCCDNLNTILREAQELHPKATLYLDGTSNLHLMSGDSHDENCNPRQDRVLSTAHLNASGGDW